MTYITEQTLKNFGYTKTRNSVHTARTMMLNELSTLLEYQKDLNTNKDTYINAIVQDNCLAKRSGRTREITARHLIELYGLDPNMVLFFAIRYLWDRDTAGQPLIALLSAYARDEILRMCGLFIVKQAEGTHITREMLEGHIESLYPDRFSTATLKSTAQNVNSTFTQSGHLKGRVKKYRIKAQSTPGAVAYALLLGYLIGIRGTLLFETEYVKLLDCSKDKALDLAKEAARRGWINVKHIGDVFEVSFPNFLK